jgi:hypothetical protein
LKKYLTKLPAPIKKAENHQSNSFHAIRDIEVKLDARFGEG